MSAILGVIQNYSTLAWSTPRLFRDLIAKPLDLVGKWCEFQGLDNHFGAGLIRDMTRLKDMIGALRHLQEPKKLLPILEGENLVDTLNNMTSVGFAQWELLNYLKGVKFFHFPERFEKYLGWYGTVNGTVLCLTNLKTELSKKSISQVKVALNSSALALSVLYNPMWDAKNDYKLAKVIATTVMVVAGAINSYNDPKLRGLTKKE